MGEDIEEIFKQLHKIYRKHLKRNPQNQDSKQMCCMWSSIDPPDYFEDTEPLMDLEDAFGIMLSEAEAASLYDMDLEEAAKRIVELIILQS